MRHTIVKKSDLGDRWDAPFHIAREKLKQRTKQLEATIERTDAIARLSTLPSHAKKGLEILCRGTPRGMPSHGQIASAIKEYPFLALAIVEEHMAPAMERIRETLARNEKALDDLLSVTRPTENAVVQDEQPDDARHERPRPGFLYALLDPELFDDENGEGYGYAILPTEAGANVSTAWLNDMWIVNASGELHPGYCDCPIPVLTESLDFERARRIDVDLPEPRNALESSFSR